MSATQLFPDLGMQNLTMWNSCTHEGNASADATQKTPPPCVPVAGTPGETSDRISFSHSFFLIRVTTPNQISKNQRISQHKLNLNLQLNFGKYSSNTSAGTHELRRIPYSFYVAMWAKEKYEKLSVDAGSTEKHFSSDYPY